MQNKTLPLDYSRCAARYDFTDTPKWCADKDSCMRHLAFIKLDLEAGVSRYEITPVLMGADNCGSKIEVLLNG